MVGLLGEEEEDLDVIVEMILILKKVVFGLRLSLGCSIFVLKFYIFF